MARRVKAGQQLELKARTWGGRRDGAGRNRAPGRGCVPHRERAEIDARHPIHVTLRVRSDVPSLRKRSAWATIVAALRAARTESRLHVVHYSVMGNHLHLIIELAEGASLESTMRGLTTRLARRLNARFGRHGAVFAGRYHAHELATPLEVRRALAYVLLNYRKHAAERGEQVPSGWFDPRSTAVTFDGWSQPIVSRFTTYDFGTTPAATWLLRDGWRRHGPIELDTAPAHEQKRRAT